MAEGNGGVWNLNSFLPEATGCVFLAHSCIPSRVPGASVSGHEGHVLSDCGDGGDSVDRGSQLWGIKASEELGFWCQRRKEE